MFEYSSDSLAARLFSVQRTIQSGALPPSIIPFGEWLPDRADLANPGTTEAKNVIPTADGYAPFPNLSAVSSNALTARAQGAVGVTDSSGNAIIFAGDATKLYKMTGALSLDDVSGSTYSTSAEDQWEFALYGNEVIATNYADNVQGFTVGTDTLFSTLMTSTLKPKARHVGVVRDFVVLGNTNDATDGVKPNRVWWSANNDPTDFDPAASTQSDFQDIPDAGWVRGIVGGRDFGLIFLERAIYRMTYVGSPLVFRFDAVEDARGTPIPGSVISLGRSVFYITPEGFFVTDGLSSVPIGNEKVDRWFWDQIGSSYFHRVTAAYLPLRKTIMWGFPGTGNSGGTPNFIVMFNIAEKKWSYAEVSHEILLRSLSLGYTLDTLDSVTTDLDSLSLSLDSRAWTGGEYRLAAFDTSHMYGAFTGSNLAATLETTEFQPMSNGNLSTLHGVRPLVDGGTITGAVASRNTQQATQTFGSAVSIEANGNIPFLSTGRYHKARVSIAAAGSWTHAQGVQINATDAGTD